MVLLDLTMPLISGYEVLKRIREDEKLRDTPVIIQSAFSREEDKQYCIDLGVTAFLTKPFNLMELEACVKSILEP